MRVSKVAIAPARMRLLVEFEPGEQRYTTEDLIAKAIRRHPSLPSHSCINSEGPTFGDIMGKTSRAHLLEHLVIAEQSVLASRRGVENATFVGTTQWLDEDHTAAEVQVSFLDDLEAVHALSNALEFFE